MVCSLALPDLLTYFDEQPGLDELPEVFPSPFALEPCALAKRAAQVLQDELRTGRFAVHEAEFNSPGAGKMFGVLVVRDQQGRVGFLRAVSGMLGKEWQVAGLAPPAFDLAAHDASWPAGQERLNAMEAARHAFADAASTRSLLAREGELDAAQRAERAQVQELHSRRRAARAARRVALQQAAGSAASRQLQLQDLEEASRADTRELRELRQRHKDERATFASELSELRAKLDGLKAESVAYCNLLLAGVRERYHICNARGECRSLLQLFAPKEPPGGTGDCAAPKLLCYAHRHSLRPLALAEFWWGAGPAGGGRVHGQYYPACRGKCEPLMHFMLEGIEQAAAPIFATETAPRSSLLRVYEDEYLIVVDKPAGMLSVPGASERLQDCAQLRVQAECNTPGYPLAVHRLDLDTSGLLLLAKSQLARTLCQRLFAERKVEKHYLAWLNGELPGQLGSAGRIDLALRVDLDDRPRQIVDTLHGKPARTDYELLARCDGFTKVRLTPHTGRSHQLRVHCSHPQGLGAAIVGDRLYGISGARLLLHAEFLAFRHPFTGQMLEIRSPAGEEFSLAAVRTNT